MVDIKQAVADVAVAEKNFLVALNELDAGKIENALNDMIAKKEVAKQEAAAKDIVNHKITTRETDAEGLTPLQMVVVRAKEEGATAAAEYLLSQGAKVAGETITYTPDIKTGISQGVFKSRTETFLGGTEGTPSVGAPKTLEERQEYEDDVKKWAEHPLNKLNVELGMQKGHTNVKDQLIGQTKEFTIDMASFPRTQGNFGLSEILRAQEKIELGIGPMAK